MTYVCVLTFVDKRVVVTVNFEWWDDDAHSPPHFSFSLLGAMLMMMRGASKMFVLTRATCPRVFSSLPSACVRVCNAFISRIYIAPLSQMCDDDDDEWCRRRQAQNTVDRFRCSRLKTSPWPGKALLTFLFIFRVCVWKVNTRQNEKEISYFSVPLRICFHVVFAHFCVLSPNEDGRNDE